jgi:hypothetical protein
MNEVFDKVSPAANGFYYVSEMFAGEADWRDAQQVIYAKLRASKLDPGSGRWKSTKIERDGTLWCHVLTWTTEPKGHKETPAD